MRKKKERITHGEVDNKIACNKEMSLACGWQYTLNPERYPVTCKRCKRILAKGIQTRLELS